MADLPSGISWSLRRHLEVVSVSLGLPSTTLGFVTVFPSGSPREVVLDLWVLAPLGMSGPFTGVT